MPFDLGMELNDAFTVLQLRAQWTLGSQARGESSWSLILFRNGLIDQPALVWDMWHANCYAPWRERRPTSWVMNRGVVQDRYPGVRPDLVIDLNEPGLGASADSWPGQFGPVISWRTALQGRSYRGRTYWGPGMRDDLESDFINEDCSDNIESFVDSMISTFRAGAVGETSPQLAIVSRRHNGLPEPVGRFALVNGTRTVRVMGTQRRRLQWWNL